MIILVICSLYLHKKRIMARPKRKRQVQMAPKSFGFKPIDANEDFAGFEIELHLDEYESLRLADYEDLTQEDASVFMKVSRPTFARIYDSARKKIVQAMVENKSIIIAGGKVNFDAEWYRCYDCDDVFIGDDHDCNSTEQEHYEHINVSLNRGRHFSSFTQGIMCECTKCHKQHEKKRGVPCRDLVCPDCETKTMIRKVGE